MRGVVTSVVAATGITDVGASSLLNRNFDLNNLEGLGALGLELPSPAYLLGSLVFGIVGYIVFRRGRKTSKPELTWTGLALMVYPYAISQTWLLWLLGMAMCGWVYTRWE